MAKEKRVINFARLAIVEDAVDADSFWLPAIAAAPLRFGFSGLVVQPAVIRRRFAVLVHDGVKKFEVMLEGEG